MSAEDPPIKPVQRSLLVPLTVVLVLLVGGSGFVVLNMHQRHMRQAELSVLTHASHELNSGLAAQSQELSDRQEILLGDPVLREALMARDRQRLLRAFKDAFAQLREQHGVTHFYFHLPDRVCLLRLHQPDSFGDLIDRATLRQAARTGQTTSGIELGPLGTLTLRVVRPVFQGATLIGYLELGKEIEDILARIHEKDGVELAVIIHKHLLDRGGWDKGMAMLGRAAEWDHYEDHVLIYSSLSQFPPECDQYISEPNHPHHGSNINREVAFNGKEWRVQVDPLLDFSGTNVGELFIMNDISAIEAAYDRDRAIAAALSLALLLGLLGFFYFRLQRVDRSIAKQQADLRQAAEELRRLRNYLSNIIDSMPSVLIGVSPDGKVTQWNTEAEQRFGVTAEAVLDQPLESVIPQMAGQMERVREALRQREMCGEIRQPRKVDSETRYEDVTVYPLTANGIEGAVIRIDDVTDRVRIEEMMIQSEKMLSVGGLAAGMAHEINNPLGGMIQTASVVTDRLTDLSMPANRRAAEAVGVSLEKIRAYMEARKITVMLDRIRESGARAAEIVANMLSFARKADCTRSSHPLSDLLDQSVQLARSDYDLKKKYDFRQIEIVREYEDGLPPVPCEAGKIQQVFLNILRNGAEAMQQGGDGKQPRFTLRLSHDRDASMIHIEIEDNGPGMDEATQKRVFEPFFTTKPTDQGTGLGLSVSYFIITTNHGGELRVESAAGQGTKFIIRLPLGDRPRAQKPPIAPLSRPAGKRAGAPVSAS